MQSLKWVHIPFRRGLDLVQQQGREFHWKEDTGFTFSAWGLTLSNDGFMENVRLAGVVFLEAQAGGKTLKVHLGWIERSSDTRGYRSRMIADFMAMAWGRWIDAQQIFLCGRHGDGVALTREMSNQESRVVQWALGRMRATSDKRVHTHQKTVVRPEPSRTSIWVPVEQNSGSRRKAQYA